MEETGVINYGDMIKLIKFLEIMEEIDKMFNQGKLKGIGNLQFYRADNLTLSPWIGGYSMRYKINEFN